MSATTLTSNIRLTIGSVKLSVPPSHAIATAKSTPSYTMKAASNVVSAITPSLRPARRRATPRAATVVRTAAAPRTAPQAKLLAVQGYWSTAYPRTWLASQTATVRRTASLRDSVRAAAAPNAAKGVAQAKTKLNAALAATSMASQTS